MSLQWRLEYHDELRIVELHLAGLASGPELQRAAAERIEFGRQQQAHKFIINAADIIAPKSLTLDVYDIPAAVYADHKMERTSRIAVVESRDPASRWVSKFYEDASVNRGWTVQSFAERDSAVAWLNSFT